MKKMNVILLILVFALSLSLTACGESSGNTPSNSDKPAVAQSEDMRDNDNEAPGGNDTTGNNHNESDGIYKEVGEELTDFFSGFESAMNVYEPAINAFETEDFEIFDAASDYLVSLAYIGNVASYDYTASPGNDEGKVREESGGVITFSQNLTRTKDGFNPNDKTGDVVSMSGSLDTSTNTLLFESSVQRDDAVITRMVTEAVMLSDGTFLVQLLNKPIPQTDRGIEDKGEAYFVRCGKDKLEIIKATFAPDVNFTYTSIEGKTDSTPEDMAQGYEKIRKTTAEGGEAKVEKY
ncbi:MAG: hypothetical protein APF84_07195 [Gracilibacter sp. BRH_c7a]|nr:MAG: hypothetical protein APF84_07195 [Gracilibacter sp. BRH_c7a]